MLLVLVVMMVVVLVVVMMTATTAVVTSAVTGAVAVDQRTVVPLLLLLLLQCHDSCVPCRVYTKTDRQAHELIELINHGRRGKRERESVFDLTCLLEVVRPAVKAEGSSFPQTKISTFTTSMVVLVAVVVVVVVEAQRRQTKVLRCAKRRNEKRYK